MVNKTGSSTTAKKICSACGKAKQLARDFFISYNDLHKDKRSPMCKDCIKNSCYNDSGEFDVDNLQSILRQLDRPYIQDTWESAISEVEKSSKETDDGFYDAVIGKYMKTISLPQNRAKKWTDSVFQTQKNISEGTRRKTNFANDKVYYLPQDSFEVTEDIIRLFGEGYTAKEYEIMTNYYETLKQDYPSLTNSQKKLLLRYVRLAAKEEIATSLGQTAEAEKWAKIASEALKQLNQSDLQGSVNSFAEFFQKVERAKDIVPILPKYKYRPNDAPDFIIWCFINYCRRLEGKTECSYEDIYRFYDEKKNEYVCQYGDPYGVFTNDPTLNNREKVKEFMVLPPEFNGAG